MANAATVRKAQFNGADAFALKVAGWLFSSARPWP